MLPSSSACDYNGAPRPTKRKNIPGQNNLFKFGDLA